MPIIYFRVRKRKKKEAMIARARQSNFTSTAQTLFPRPKPHTQSRRRRRRQRRRRLNFGVSRLEFSRRGFVVYIHVYIYTQAGKKSSGPFRSVVLPRVGHIRSIKGRQQ